MKKFKSENDKQLVFQFITLWNNNKEKKDMKNIAFFTINVS